MKFHLILLAVLSSSADFLGQGKKCTEVKAPFSITISAPATDVHVDSPVYIDVRLTNTSDREIASGGNAYANGLDVSYRFDCKDAEGKLVESEHRPMLLGGVGDRSTLKPGETHEEKMPISRACNLNRPGKYQIEVSRSDPGDLQHRLVKSNRITIRILPESLPISDKHE